MARPPKRPRIASVDDWRAGSASEPGFVTALARGGLVEIDLVAKRP